MFDVCFWCVVCCDCLCLCMECMSILYGMCCDDMVKCVLYLLAFVSRIVFDIESIEYKWFESSFAIADDWYSLTE